MDYGVGGSMFFRQTSSCCVWLVVIVLNCTSIQRNVAAKNPYTINLMWINERLNEDQRYVLPLESAEDFLQKLANVFAWAEKNPESIVNLWFDGKLTPNQAIENTRALIIVYIVSHPGIAQITLRDIRELPDVIQNPRIFDDPRIPVFFRADILRIIATVQSLNSGETDCFIYADLDVKSQSKEELFNEETKERLQKYGIVVAARGHLGLENSFHMATNDQDIIEAMKFLIIDLNIQYFGQF